MAVEFDLCDAIVVALNGGTYARPINPQVDGAPDVLLESHYKDNLVSVLVTPGSVSGAMSDLGGGDEESIQVSVIALAKLSSPDQNEKRVLLDITREIWSQIESAVDKNSYQFVNRSADPIYDHDFARNLQWVSECIFTYRVFRDE